MLFLGVVLPPMAIAQEAVPSPQRLMQELSGVYKERFMSATIMPGKAPGEADQPYQAEDIVEIVPVDAEHLYFRIHLDFYNGHSCGIYGMARHEDGAFVYRDRTTPGAAFPQCVLRIGAAQGRLAITDRLTPESASTCSRFCGARGSLNYSIGMDKRRPIRYLERLKDSRQYRAALVELQGPRP